MAQWLLVISEVVTSMYGGYFTQSITDYKEIPFAVEQECRDAVKRHNATFEEVQRRHPSDVSHFAQCIPNYHLKVQP